jgi:SHS2 domain-containing protein
MIPPGSEEHSWVRSFYRVIEHTADIGLEVEATSRTEIFVRSAQAMFDLMLGLNSVGRSLSRRVEVRAEGMEELLVAWLNELLYVYAVDRVVFSDFSQARLESESFSAVGWGESFDPEKHQVRLEIKAATYHQLAVRFADGKWRSSIIFDV